MIKKILFFGKNSVSTQVDEIKETDFTELYESITEIYDFFDEELTRRGDLSEVTRILHKKFKKKIIYKDSSIRIVINYLSLNNNKIHGGLNFIVSDKNIITFGQEYIDGGFWNYTKFRVVDVAINVLEIKKLLEDRLDVCEKYFEFKNDGYSFEDNYFYKKLNTRITYNILAPSTKKTLSLHSRRLEYILDSLRERLSKKYEIQNIGDNEFTVISPDEKSFDIILHKDDDLLYSGIKFGVSGIDIEKTKEIYFMLDSHLESITKLVGDKVKAIQIVKKQKQELYKALIGQEILERESCKNFIYILEEYKKLQMKGEVIYSPKVIDLLEDMLVMIRRTYREYDEDYRVTQGIKLYIIQNYNQILNSIVSEDEDFFIEYYKKKLDFIVIGGENVLVNFQELLDKLSKFSDNALIRNSIFNSIVENISDEQISIIIKILEQNGQNEIIENLYKEFIKYDTKVGLKEKGLEKYNNIDNYVVNHKIKELFEKLLADYILSYLLHTNSSINESMSEIISIMHLKKFIIDIDYFENKYLNKIYWQFYRLIISRDEKLIGKQEIDFSIYSKIADNNIDKFIFNVMIPYIVHQFATNINKEDLEENILDLEKDSRNLLAVMQYFGVNVHINMDTACVNFSSREARYCKKILEYFVLVKEQVFVNDYTRIGLDSLKKDEEQDKPTLISMPIFNANLINKLMGDEKLALDYLKNNKSFPTRVGINLAKHSSVKVRKELAKYGDKLHKKEVLALFGGKEEVEEEVVLELLKTKCSFSGKIGVKFAKHSSIAVREKLAEYGKRLDKEEILALFLLEDQSERIVLNFLETARTFPTKIGVKFAKHSSKKVRKKLARFGKILDKEEVYALFGGKEQDESVVLTFLSTGCNFPKEICKRFVEHSSTSVQKKTEKTLKFNYLSDKELIALFCGKEEVNEETIIDFLDTGCSFPGEVGIKFARHSSIYVRRKLAKYGKRLESKEMKALFLGEEEQNEIVILDFMKTTKTFPNEIGERFASHPSIDVRKKLASFGELLSKKEIIALSYKEQDESVLLILLDNTPKLSKKIEKLLFAYPSPRVTNRLLAYKIGLENK